MMRSRPTLLIIIILNSFYGFAQVADDFSDGDFLTSPEWSGTTEKFIVTDERIKSQGSSTAPDVLYLSTPNSLIENTSWEILLDIDFNGTSSNFIEVYLTSNQSDLSASPSGYFLKIGETNDDYIRLYRNDNGTKAALAQGITGFSGNIGELKMRVTYISGTWTVYSSHTDDDTFTEELSYTDTTYTETSFFGIYYQYNTVSRFDELTFDDVYIDTISNDHFLALTSISQLNESDILLVFNQALDTLSAETEANYTLTEMGHPVSASLLDSNQIALSWAQLYNSSYTLDISDLYSAKSDSAFHFETAVSIENPTDYRQIILNEIMADPTPQVGLPNAEYVELYNPGTYSIGLTGFKLNGKALDPYVLAGGAYVLITDDSDSASFQLTNSMGIGTFDALTNGGEQVTLTDQLGNLVDSVTYNLDWYQDADKEDGGYSLELIDPLQPCSDRENWTASIDNSGGTPGAENAVYNLEDHNAPTAVSLTLSDPATLLVHFSEPIAEEAVTTSSFSIEGYEIQNVSWQNWRSCLIQLSGNLLSGQEYSLEIVNLSDCRGNVTPSFALSFTADFDPPQLKKIILVSSQVQGLIFSKSLEETSAETLTHYSLDGFTIKQAVRQDSATNRIHLTLQQALQLDGSYTLSLEQLTDTNGNVLADTTATFTYQTDVDTVYVVASNILALRLTNAPQSTSAQHNANYLLNTTTSPVAVTQTDSDPSLLHLTFTQHFTENAQQLLYISNLKTAEGIPLSTPAVSFIYDTKTPSLTELQVSNDHQLLLIWNEALQENAATVSSHYLLEDDEQPVSIEKLSATNYELTFANAFPEETEKTLSIKGIEDVSGNTISTTRKVSFTYDTQPPQVTAAIYMGRDSVRISFSEQVTSTSAIDQTHYSLEGKNPQAIQLSGPDSTDVLLVFENVVSKESLDLMIMSISDLNGNLLGETHSNLNSRSPMISQMQVWNDSSLLITYSQNMSSAAFDAAGYTLNPFTIRSVSRHNNYSAWLRISENFNEGDSLILQTTDLKSTSGYELVQNSDTILYTSYFNSWTVTDASTIELSFLTEFSVLDPTAFSIENGSVSAAIPDEDESGIVRLSLATALEANQPQLLRWNNLYDLYGRRLPDFQCQVIWDTRPPVPVSISSRLNEQLLVTFSEEMNGSEGLLSINKYQIRDVGYPALVEQESDSSALLHFENRLNADAVYALIISPVADLAGNLSVTDTLSFTYTPPALPGHKEILFTEIMADPSPAVGLPEVEYVEIYNTADVVFNLSGLNFSTSSAEVTLPDLELAGHEYILLVATGKGEVFGNIPVAEVSGFPTLSNSGSRLTLTSVMGIEVDAVSYSSDWYGDTDKDDGGYSLELINLTSDCSGASNWMASVSSTGGTPGAQNSVYSTVADEDAPQVIAVELSDSQTLVISFNESMDSLSLTQLILTGAEIQTASVIDENFSTVEMALVDAITAGELINITLEGGKDCSGNQMEPYSVTIGIGDSPGFNELLITEIMADPEPVAGLPDSEYLELYNASDRLISLSGVTLAEATSSVALPAVTIAPGSYYLLVPSTSVSLFPEITNKSGVSNWPSLNNTGETLVLKSFGTPVFEITYSDDWYGDASKESGGYSLEMKDQSNPCGGALNWSASLAESGGTPGFANSNQESVPDNFGPNLTQAIALAPQTILLHFDERLAADALDYTFVSFDPSLSVNNLSFGDSYSELLVTLSEALLADEVHMVSVSGTTDCNGNFIRNSEVEVVLPDEADSLDLVINEILFNPKTDGVDFVELLNRSEKYLDLYQWTIARTDGDLDAQTLDEHYILKPGDYVALTTDTLILQNQYPSGAYKKLLETSDFPAFPNESGTATLFDPDDHMIDSFAYDESLHLAFLESVDGVSLERIDANSSTQSADNWTSAASSVGYASPGYINSQSREMTISQAELEIVPKVFVPGSANPSFDTFTTINYHLNRSGQFANVTIYNQMGQPVNQLQKGASLSTSGFFRWDGTSASGEMVRRGYYVVVFELYDAIGHKQVLKETVVVGH